MAVRRTTLSLALATGLVGAVVLPLTSASAASCASWTDAVGDATAGQSGAGPLADAQLDIVAAQVGTVGDELVARITSSALSDTSSDTGDEFRLVFTVDGVRTTLYADRTAVLGETVDAFAGVFDDQGNATPSGEATAVYDLDAKTVTITTKLSELSLATGGKAVPGQVLTELVAATSDVVPLVGLPVLEYDDAPTTVTSVLGTACTLDAAASPAPAPSAGSPSASASPSATPSTTPSPSASASPSAGPSGSASPTPSAVAPAAGPDQPRPGCTTFDDPVGDAFVPNGGPGSEEPDLDLTGLVLQSTPQVTRSFLQVEELAAAPNAGIGHVFTTSFTVGETAVQLVAQQYDGDALPASSRLVVDGATVPSSLTAVFDVERSQVVVSLPTSELTAAVPGFRPGARLTGVFGRSGSLTPVVTLNADSTNPENAAAPADTQTWVVGDNACFAPPAARLSRTGATTAQFGDAAGVALKLVDSRGAALAGRRVTVNLGSATATVTTGKDGSARTRVPVRLRAGRTVLTVAFSGDSGAGEVALRTPFTVTVEKTVLHATGGQGAVSATLLDDDRTPVAGQVLVLTAGSTTKRVRTDAKGVARASGFPAGSTVTVSYAGASGQYAASRTTAQA